MRIIYMGTPEFAVAPLDALLRNGYDVAAVVTAPDKPAGRGKLLRPSPVKVYASKNGLEVLQPPKLKNPEFLAKLRSFDADLQIVVAFRMLPEEVWAMPPLGTFNLHASLLPQYRGAAPINHVIINGEDETGLTTFFIDKEIDTGRILFREKIPVGKEETAGQLHDQLMSAGAGLVLKTVKAIESGSVKPVPQETLLSENELKPAPKIFPEGTFIEWNRPARVIYNLIRGLSPYPTARATLARKDDQQLIFKIFFARYTEEDHKLEPGTIQTDGKEYLRVAATDGFIQITDLQQPGKKRMNIKDFLRGFKDIENCKFL